MGCRDSGWGCWPQVHGHMVMRAFQISRIFVGCRDSAAFEQFALGCMFPTVFLMGALFLTAYVKENLA